MKILHILYTSPPDVSGTSVRTHQILKYQKKKGISIFPVTSPFQVPATNSMVETIDGVSYYRTYIKGAYELLNCRKRLRKRLSKIIPLFRFYRICKRIAIENNIDIIHAHATFFCGITAFILSKRLKKPFIYEVRSNWIKGMIECGAFSEKSFLSRLYYLLESFIIKRASEIVIIGKNLREYIRSMGRTKIEKCPVIYNCVDLEECEKLLSDIGVDNNIDNKHVTFGYIGSLYNFEGLDDLIRVFSKIKAKYSNCELIIVGSGECLSDLKKLADDLFVEVTFTGRIERERIGEYYNKIDVIVLPRKDLIVTNQVTPLKPLEAMGFKKAVIGSNVGGMQEIIDGSNGVLYRAGDNKDLYKKMEQFIINPSLINDFGRIGNKWVSQHRNWLVEISKYTRLYERILKK